MKSTVVDLRNEGFRIETIDIRQNRGMAKKYKIRSVPTFIYIVDEKPVRRVNGSTTKTRVRNMFRKTI
ncbi:MAG: thioredoxin family protein [Planctomycetales bacterium]|nr:thioredoxin family protein [Planctomycetales bacterium]